MTNTMHLEQSRIEENPISSRCLLFLLVFGVVFMVYGMASEYWEISLIAASHASAADNFLIVCWYPPEYPFYIFWSGMFLVLIAIALAAFSVASRLVRRICLGLGRAL